MVDQSRRRSIGLPLTVKQGASGLTLHAVIAKESL